MSTRSLVAEIQLKAPNWTAEGTPSILQLLQRAQDYLFSQASRFSLYRDPLTGDFPYLATTANQREYTMSNINMTIESQVRSLRIYDVSEVFADFQTVSDYSLNTINGVGAIAGQIVSYNFIPYPALEATACRIVLTDDPGTTSTKYQLKMMIEPLRLTSLSIPLMVSRNYESVLMEGVLGYIENTDYGRSDRQKRFEEVLAPQFWSDGATRNMPRRVSRTGRRKF